MEGLLTKRVVVKAARYEAEVFPASINASVKPGRPEMWVYTKAIPVMGAFIPQVLLACEEEPGRRYVYVLEDLTGGYGKKRSGPLGWRDGINGLFRVQEALALAVDENGADQLLLYDDAYSEALVSYAKRAVAAYDGGSDGSVRERLLQTWPLLEETYLGDGFDLSTGGVPIHGDFDTRNVFIHRRDRDQVKVVDWEWAGLGWPHSDLASYLKRAPSEVVSSALDQIAKRDESKSPSDHERLFFRARLERAILDSALLATQYTADRGRFGYLGPTVNEALSRSLGSLDRLRSH